MTRTNYLLIGDGRWAQHLRFYLKSLNIPYETWSRREDDEESLSSAIERARHQPTPAVLLAIKDDALPSFFAEHLWDFPGPVVHFSGCLVHSKMIGLHPLGSFHDELFPPNFYQELLFVGEEGRTPFPEIFPELPNPWVQISPDQKPRYHALCALAANLTQFVWGECFSQFQKTLGLSTKEMTPFLKSTLENLVRNPYAMTGPLVRGDFETVQNHEEALSQHPLEGLYRAFVHAYLRSQNQKEVSDENSLGLY